MLDELVRPIIAHYGPMSDEGCGVGYGFFLSETVSVLFTFTGASKLRAYSSGAKQVLT